jgi:hypothetical protein
MPDPASIKLSREGISVTVTVGDVVPMVNGCDWREVVAIQGGYPLLSNDMIYDLDGACISRMYTGGGRIDIPKFAALATPGAQAVPVERLLGLAKELRERADRPYTTTRGIGFADGLNECAAALEALAKGGDGGK